MTHSIVCTIYSTFRQQHLNALLDKGLYVHDIRVDAGITSAGTTDSKGHDPTDLLLVNQRTAGVKCAGILLPQQSGAKHAVCYINCTKNELILLKG